jgi:hypothetical protein
VALRALCSFSLIWVFNQDKPQGQLRLNMALSRKSVIALKIAEKQKRAREMALLSNSLGERSFPSDCTKGI